MQYTESLMLSRMSVKPRTARELSNGYVATHTDFYLSALREKGYCVEVGEKWHITKFGVEALKDYKNPRAGVRKKVNSAEQEKYDGAELRHRVQRRGAYDFLACPSRVGDSFVYRPEAV